MRIRGIVFLLFAFLVAASPVSAVMNGPTGQEFFQYSAVADPVKNAAAAQAMPFGAGSVAAGGETITLKAGFDQFSSPVDIYLGIYIPYVSQDIFLITESGGIQALSTGLAKWRSGVTGGVDASFFGDIPTSALPAGEYTLYVMVTPANSLNSYYFWATDFYITIPEPVVTNALRDLGPKIDALVVNGVPPDPEAARQALASVPNVNVLGKGPDNSIWAEIGVNGPLVVIKQPEPFGADSAANLPDLMHVFNNAERSAAAATSVPDGKTILLMSGFTGTYTWTDPTPALASFINGTGKGYIATPMRATISALRTVKDIKPDVFYIKAHGDLKVCMDKPGCADNELWNSVFVLTSADKADPGNWDFDKLEDAKLKEDIQRHRIAFVYEAVDATLDLSFLKKYQWLFGITSGFVNTYWQFNKDSFVFVDACSSAHPGATRFVDAVVSNGASAYAGWSLPVNVGCADKRATFFFDRLLGANTSDAKLNPPQRPFDIEAVRDELQRKNLLQCTGGDKAGPSELTIYTGDGFGILAPSIERLEVDEVNEILSIYGIFGKQAGHTLKVFFGPGSNEEVAYKEWTENKITVDLPATKKAGNVMVTINDIKSNKVPLTEWRGTFTDTTTVRESDKEDVVKITWDLHFRKDVHKCRKKSGEAPEICAKGGAAAKDSKATYACLTSGTSGNLTNLFSSPFMGIDGYYGHALKVDSDAKTMDLMLFAMTSDVRTGAKFCGKTMIVAWNPYLSGCGGGGAMGGGAVLLQGLSLSENLSIPVTPNPLNNKIFYCPSVGSDFFKIEMKWDSDIKAEFPPNAGGVPTAADVPDGYDAAEVFRSIVSRASSAAGPAAQ